MIGLDTNIIVRYVVQDDPVQSGIATKVIDSLTAAEPGFVSVIVLAELVWVLDFSYHSTKETIEQVIQALLNSKEMVIEQAEIVSQALRLFKTGEANFADFLIERIGNRMGCTHTITFDRRAARSAGMHLLK